MTATTTIARTIYAPRQSICSIRYCLGTAEILPTAIPAVAIPSAAPSFKENQWGKKHKGGKPVYDHEVAGMMMQILTGQPYNMTPTEAKNWILTEGTDPGGKGYVIMPDGRIFKTTTLQLEGEAGTGDDPVEDYIFGSDL